MSVMKRLRTYASFVRFGHSVFALPFALAGALLAARHAAVTWRTAAWILVAMVAARSAAMGFNRLADARTDALNPRTAARELPRGAMTMREARRRRGVPAGAAGRDAAAAFLRARRRGGGAHADLRAVARARERSVAGEAGVRFEWVRRDSVPGDSCRRRIRCINEQGTPTTPCAIIGKLSTQSAGELIP